MFSLFGVLFLGFILVTTEASVINFDVSTHEIHPLLTDHIEMQCQLNDTMSATNGAIVGKRGITSSSTNVHVTSIMITRGNNQDVAGITPYSPVTAYVDQSLSQVSGQLSETAGQRGYVKMEWQHPGEGQAGTYQCEILGVTDRGHHVVFTKNLTITSVSPTLKDLVHYVHDLKSQVYTLEAKAQSLETEKQTINETVRDLDAKVHSLEADKVSMSSKISSIESDKVSMSSKISSLESDKDSMNVTMNDMKVDLDTLGHIENGTIDCRNGGHWGITDPYRSDMYSGSVTHRFVKPYKKPPVIHFTPVDLFYALKSGQDDTWYNIYVESYDETGFTLRCRMNNEVDVYRMEVNWLSLPAGNN